MSPREGGTHPPFFEGVTRTLGPLPGKTVEPRCKETEVVTFTGTFHEAHDSKRKEMSFSWASQGYSFNSLKYMYEF